jgi:ATP-dependent DNA helicase RecQ
MTLAEHGLGFDLELDGRGRRTAVGAVLDGDEFRRDRPRPLAPALRALDAFAAPAAFVFGHNILWHDLRWLAKHAPDLALLHKPAIDTLVLSAVAFAEHPYHALLKDYKIVRDAANDSVADARIAARLLADAQQRLRELATANPTFGRVVHALGVRGLGSISEQAGAGMAIAFADISPPSTDLDGDVHALLADRTCTSTLQTLLPLADQAAERQLALLFAVAWLRVAGTHDATSPSVVMPWVRRSRARCTTSPPATGCGSKRRSTACFSRRQTGCGSGRCRRRLRRDGASGCHACGPFALRRS